MGTTMCPCRKRKGDDTSQISVSMEYKKGDMDPNTAICLEACIDCITDAVKAGNGEEGLLRIPGNNLQWRAILREILLNPTRAKDYLKEADIHDTCSIMKQLLRDIQGQSGSILTNDGYNMFENAKDVNELRLLVFKLPERNRIILHKLSAMCRVVCADKKSRMTPSACATVLIPNIVSSNGNPEEVLKRYANPKNKVLFTNMLEVQDEIFGPLPEYSTSRPSGTPDL
ncbi:hypothetical protein AAMO2058_001370200 [Amorphochlora amoebiformis]